MQYRVSAADSAPFFGLPFFRANVAARKSGDAWAASTPVPLGARSATWLCGKRGEPQTVADAGNRNYWIAANDGFLGTRVRRTPTAMAKVAV